MNQFAFLREHVRSHKKLFNSFIGWTVWCVCVTISCKKTLLRAWIGIYDFPMVNIEQNVLRLCCSIIHRQMPLYRITPNTYSFYCIRRMYKFQRNGGHQRFSTATTSNFLLPIRISVSFASAQTHIVCEVRTLCGRTSDVKLPSALEHKCIRIIGSYDIDNSSVAWICIIQYQRWTGNWFSTVKKRSFIRFKF